MKIVRTADSVAQVDVWEVRTLGLELDGQRLWVPDPPGEGFFKTVVRSARVLDDLAEGRYLKERLVMLGLLREGDGGLEPTERLQALEPVLTMVLEGRLQEAVAAEPELESETPGLL